MLFDSRPKRKARRRTRRNPAEPKLLVDSHAGIYVPQEFAQQYDMKQWHVKPEDAAILKAGPNHEYYWDTWDTVEGSAWATVGGTRYYLYHPEDLWAAPEDFDFEAAGWM